MAEPRILLIDDDPNVREVVGALLTYFGYECQTAADGRTGLARFAEGGWDLVVTDLVMPDVSGWNVIESIQQRAPTMPIVLISGLTDPKMMERARKSRVPVVTKPFALETLKAVLNEALTKLT
jgi:CheY-like chemotaxis protein